MLAVEGGSFSKYQGQGEKALVAFLFAEGVRPAELRFRRVDIDGMDATDRLLEVIGELLAEGEGVDAVMSGSVPIAGFNLIDAGRVFERHRIPTIFVLRERPDEAAVEAALRKHFSDWRERLDIIKGAGSVREMTPDGEQLLLECVGIDDKRALRMVRSLTVFGKLPEPLRIARMVCRAAAAL